MALLSGGAPAIPYGLDRVLQGFAYHSATLSGNVTLDSTYPNVLKLDPGGSARDVTLPAESGCTGRIYWIVNAADNAENLVVKDDSPATVATINQNESGVFYCDGSSWSLVCLFTIALS